MQFPDIRWFRNSLRTLSNLVCDRRTLAFVGAVEGLARNLPFRTLTIAQSAYGSFWAAPAFKLPIAFRPPPRESRLAGRTTPFQFFEGARPVLSQQSGESSVGQKSPSGLAGWAIIRFILGVDNSLNWRPAFRTRFAETAMYRHLVPESRDLFRKVSLRVFSKRSYPEPECLLYGVVQPPSLVFIQPRCQLQR